MAKHIQLLPDWAPNQSCWMSLPRQPQVWGDTFHSVQQTIIEIANTIIDFEPVQVLCEPGQKDVAKRSFDSRIELVEMPTDELWLRDASPVFAAKRGKVRGMQFQIGNSSTGNLAHDLCDLLGIGYTRLKASLVAGDFSVDGSGSLLLCKSVINQPYKRQISDDLIKRMFERVFDISRIIWLPQALNFDSSSKLINLARFVAPSEILVASHANTGDANMTITLNAYDELAKPELLDPFNGNYSIYQVRNPAPLKYKGRKLCASYVNYYIGNGIVCIPGFYKPKFDKAAHDTFSKLFPHHQIFQFPVLPLLAMGGGLHCITRGFPLSPRKLPRLLDRLDKWYASSEKEEPEEKEKKAENTKRKKQSN